MSNQATKKHLGKHRSVGEKFYTTTKQMFKHHWILGNTKWEVLRQGDRRFFVKGKRTYYCEVLGLVETRTGLAGIDEPEHSLNNRISGRRWWSFTYLVKILEN